MIEILTGQKRGAGKLLREAGLWLILLAIGQEAEALTGGLTERSDPMVNAELAPRPTE